MENVKKDAKTNPAASANLLSKLIFWWLNPLFRAGYKRKLEEDDIYPVLEEDSSEMLGQQLQRYWDHEVQAATKELRKPKLSRVIIRCFWKIYSVLGLFTLVEEVIKVIQPVLLGYIIRYFEDYDPHNKAALNETLGYAAGLSIFTIGLNLLHHLYFFNVQRVGMKIRVAMCHMIYKKALCLSYSAMGKTTTGQIVNLLSNDVNKFDDLTVFLHFLWVGPLQAAAVVGLLWLEIGPSCLAGMVVLMFLMPTQTLFGRLFSKFRSRTAILTDSRIRTMNEVVSGIRIIKMYAWEKPFAALVSDVRRKEIYQIMMSSYLRGLNMSSFFCASKIIVFITFTLYVLLGNKISASRVFVTVSLYTAVRLTVTLFFPSAIEKLYESRVSIQRIQEFLLLEEMTKTSTPLPHAEKQDSAVEIQDLMCYWDKDLELLPDGDLTLIGDRGATLSGGQKARVNLARAVYQDADIYLLDDPLSAVDAEVGRHLFEQCICGVLKSKPRILVTHQLQYLKGADQIVVLKEGHMVAKGTYTELQRSGLDFTSLLKKDEEEEPHQSPTDFSSRSRTLSQNSVRSQASSGHSVQDGEHLEAEPVHTVAEESRAQGSIGLNIYIKYLRAGASVLVVVIALLLNILAQVAYIVQDWWLAYWAEEQGKLDINSTMEHNVTQVDKELDLEFYLGIYGGLTAATIIFGFVRTLLMFNVLVRSTQALHNSMFNAILRTHVRFFDVNPIGRVLNRFSKDIGQLDSIMPWTFVDFIQVFLQILGVVAVAVGVIPWILLPVLPLLIVFIFLRRYFLETSRDIKRLESTTRSPVFSHLSSSLQGLWTIRAFRAEGRFQKAFDAHQDLHSAAWFLFLTTSRWFAIRLDGMCSIFVTITTFGCLLLRDQLDAGSVGLALSYSITLMGMFQWGVRQSAEVENLMTSVERVMEYTELESEAPWETKKRPPPGWPSKGLVTFDGVSFSYSADGPRVLDNLKVTFQPKEKVGIVGRTGAGKSSLVSALFRLAEPEGKIYIDGMLTSELGLHDIRQKMSIIPQDPVLFTGSMRKNLDPFNQHSEEELWNALQEVQLKGVVEELPGKLETVLAESGSNFSVGQRQLVCLARAILRKNRILIIDEATANVDPRTDELIQRTIREKFQECTVLTIAHRLNTIIDSDRILVLDAGRIHGYDEPYTLLLDPSSIFRKMVQQTGKQEAAALLEAAKKAYESRSRPNLSSGEADGPDRSLVIFETAL
ncbi:ATP-binding cassette sub-family C member 4 isoform X2 [Hippocampus comes]|uniref:ATP-binding cassette sub-family C member 4 isoform X2 n=1 Tax=Hippocampus comes TaxID=109280 RepID=UPI00094E18B4|nr:PREDICTED: multidrug resistance-associated protein 4-like isoform X2 [Hippocampus comes]